MTPKRYHLRKSAIRKLAKRIKEEFGEKTELKGKKFEMVELRKREVLLVDDLPFLFKSGDEIFPTLYSVERFGLKKVTVDMGAVPHIVNGADVMSPGVTQVDTEISTNDKVVVVDERHGKVLAVGVALVPAREMKKPKGKVVKIAHHVGDEIWNLTHIGKKLYKEKSMDN